MRSHRELFIGFMPNDAIKSNERDKRKKDNKMNNMTGGLSLLFEMVYRSTEVLLILIIIMVLLTLSITLAMKMIE